MTKVLAAAEDLQAVCDRHRWRYCFIGGLAVLRWGEPRETVDVDLTLLTGFSREDEYIRALLDAFEPRREDAVEFARVNRVLLLRAASGVGSTSPSAVCPSRSRLSPGHRRSSSCPPSRSRRARPRTSSC